MKRNLTSLLSELRNEQLELLTTVVKETLAKGYEKTCSVPKNRVFSSADLWNIQRQGKNRAQRRFAF